MLLKSGPGHWKDVIFRYFKGSDSLDDQPLPEVEKALIDDRQIDLLSKDLMARDASDAPAATPPPALPNLPDPQ